MERTVLGLFGRRLLGSPARSLAGGDTLRPPFCHRPGSSTCALLWSERQPGPVPEAEVLAPWPQLPSPRVSGRILFPGPPGVLGGTGEAGSPGLGHADSTRPGELQAFHLTQGSRLLLVATDCGAAAVSCVGGVLGSIREQDRASGGRQPRGHRPAGGGAERGLWPRSGPAQAEPLLHHLLLPALQGRRAWGGLGAEGWGSQRRVCGTCVPERPRLGRAPQSPVDGTVQFFGNSLPLGRLSPASPGGPGRRCWDPCWPSLGPVYFLPDCSPSRAVCRCQLPCGRTPAPSLILTWRLPGLAKNAGDRKSVV